MGEAKVKLPFASTERLFASLFCNTSPEPDKPVTDPPMVYVTGGGVTVVGEGSAFTLVPPQPVREIAVSMANVAMKGFQHATDCQVQLEWPPLRRLAGWAGSDFMATGLYDRDRGASR